MLIVDTYIWRFMIKITRYPIYFYKLNHGREQLKFTSKYKLLKQINHPLFDLE